MVRFFSCGISREVDGWMKDEDKEAAFLQPKEIGKRMSVEVRTAY